MITKYPDMEGFLHAHKKDILSPIDMGIMAHLHMDAVYVTDFWPKYFNFQNEYGRKTNDTREHLFAHIHKSGEIIPLENFFSSKYFYGEYDILNPYIMEKYNVIPPDISTYNKDDIHIPECIPENPEDIEKCLNIFIPVASECNDTKPDISTHIFKVDDIINFLADSSVKYGALYNSL
jgi:hypothetical protein